MTLWKLINFSTGATKKLQSGVTKYITLPNWKTTLKLNPSLPCILEISPRPTKHSKLMMESPKSLTKPSSPILTNKLWEKNIASEAPPNSSSSNTTMNNSPNSKENSTSKPFKNSSYSINTPWSPTSTKELLKNYTENLNLPCSCSLTKPLLITPYKSPLKRPSETTPKDWETKMTSWWCLWSTPTTDSEKDSLIT